MLKTIAKSAHVKRVIPKSSWNNNNPITAHPIKINNNGLYKILISSAKVKINDNMIPAMILMTIL